MPRSQIVFPPVVKHELALLASSLASSLKTKQTDKEGGGELELKKKPAMCLRTRTDAPDALTHAHKPYAFCHSCPTGPLRNSSAIFSDGI